MPSTTPSRTRRSVALEPERANRNGLGSPGVPGDPQRRSAHPAPGRSGRARARRGAGARLADPTARTGDRRGVPRRGLRADARRRCGSVRVAARVRDRDRLPELPRRGREREPGVGRARVDRARQPGVPGAGWGQRAPTRSGPTCAPWSTTSGRRCTAATTAASRRPGWRASSRPSEPSKPGSPSATAFYDDSVRQLNAALAARRDRLQSAAGGLPRDIVILLAVQHRRDRRLRRARRLPALLVSRARPRRDRRGGRGLARRAPRPRATRSRVTSRSRRTTSGREP